MIMIQTLTSSSGDSHPQVETQLKALNEAEQKLKGGLSGGWLFPFPFCMQGEDLPCRY